MQAAARIRRIVPGIPLVVEFSSSDWVDEQVELAAEAGADIVSVLGLDDPNRIERAVRAARRHHVGLTIGLPNHANVEEWCPTAEAAGVDALTIIRNIDSSKGADHITRRLVEVTEATDLPIVISGGFSPPTSATSSTCHGPSSSSAERSSTPAIPMRWSNTSWRSSPMTEVESIKESDAEDLVELFSNAGPYVSARTQSDYWLYARLFSTTCLCIRDDNGKPIAALIAFIDQTPCKREIYIQDVAVNVTQRQTRIGYTLIRHLVQIAASASMDRIWLTSEPTNDAALRLWQKLGFINRRSDYAYQEIWITRDLKGPGKDRAVFERRPS